jgi:hypothetical protein
VEPKKHKPKNADSPRALFLDRDGTLILDKHYLSDPAGVEIIPGVRDALQHASALGEDVEGAAPVVHLGDDGEAARACERLRVGVAVGAGVAVGFAVGVVAGTPSG